MGMLDVIAYLFQWSSFTKKSIEKNYKALVEKLNLSDMNSFLFSLCVPHTFGAMNTSLFLEILLEKFYLKFYKLEFYKKGIA